MWVRLRRPRFVPSLAKPSPISQWPVQRCSPLGFSYPNSPAQNERRNNATSITQKLHNRANPALAGRGNRAHIARESRAHSEGEFGDHHAQDDASLIKDAQRGRRSRCRDHRSGHGAARLQTVPASGRHASRRRPLWTCAGQSACSAPFSWWRRGGGVEDDVRHCWRPQ